MNNFILETGTFNHQGLNIQHLFDLQDLPAAMVADINNVYPNENYQQLLLLGHQGRQLWHSIPASYYHQQDPIDRYTIDCVKNYFTTEDYLTSEEGQYQLLYPISDSLTINLQQLGELAGWHYASPFSIGVNEQWGSWFAYRAVVLLKTKHQLDNTNKPLTKNTAACPKCVSKFCITACPSKALESAELDISLCLDYRKKTDSICQFTCLARVACPVAAENRYSDEQVRYHYNESLKVIMAM